MVAIIVTHSWKCSIQYINSDRDWFQPVVIFPSIFSEWCCYPCEQILNVCSDVSEMFLSSLLLYLFIYLFCGVLKSFIFPSFFFLSTESSIEHIARHKQAAEVEVSSLHPLW